MEAGAAKAGKGDGADLKGDEETSANGVDADAVAEVAGKEGAGRDVGGGGDAARRGTGNRSPVIGPFENASCRSEKDALPPCSLPRRSKAGLAAAADALKRGSDLTAAKAFFSRRTARSEDRAAEAVAIVLGFVGPESDSGPTEADNEMSTEGERWRSLVGDFVDAGDEAD